MLVRKPLWFPRLRLMPHHFEFQDAYHEALLSEQLACLHEFTWGLVELKIHPQSVETGQVVLSGLKAVLPDGTPIELGEESGQLARTFPALEEGQTLDVYVGVPLPSADAPNVDRDGDPRTLRRYIERKAAVTDLVTGRDSIELSWSRPNVCLLFQGERLDSFSTLRCARLIRPVGGRTTLDDRFIPSVLNIGAAPALPTAVRQILHALTTRQTSLLAQRSRPTSSEISGVDALRYWMLGTVGAFVPRVADLLEHRNVHPHEVYGVLSELQGALAAFTPSGTSEMSKFNYFDLSSTFDGLFASVLRILESLGQQQYREIALRRHDDRLVYGELREPAIFRNEFFIGIVGADAEALRQQVPRLVKVAAWDEVPSIISSSVGGVPVRHEYRAPSVLPSKPGILYFRLDKTAAAWASIVRKGTIGIYHPPDFGKVEIFVFAVDPSLA